MGPRSTRWPGRFDASFFVNRQAGVDPGTLSLFTFTYHSLELQRKRNLLQRISREGKGEFLESYEEKRDLGTRRQAVSEEWMKRRSPDP